jgi:hypothetical protein
MHTVRSRRLGALRSFVIAAAAAAMASATHADSVTLTDQNASLKFTTDPPGFNLGQPNDPVQLPRTLEWTVDGRRILVYPSGPFTFIDVAHLHGGAHVAAHQLHAQGPMLGFGSGAMTGSVLGGTVYSVHGGAAGSGRSRMTEKVEIHNASGGAIALSLAGLGFKPPQAALEVPDHAGLKITGSTTVYFQGSTQASSLTVAPFAPLTVLPVVSFTGFNPLLGQSLSLPAGATLVMVSELVVEPQPLVLAWVIVAVLLVVLALGGAYALRRRSVRARAG